jgi:hypothetical protein
MPLLEVIFGQQKRAKIGVVTLDASVSETHTKQNEVTDHPVEDGVDITDHVRRLPESVEIDGVISNTPLIFLASLNARSPVDGDNIPTPDRAERADKEFRRAMDSGELVNVATSLRDYTNMAITDYTVTRNAETGNILAFTIGMREIVTVTTERVEIPVPVTPSNSGVSNIGKKVPKQADAAVEGKAKESVAHSASDAIVEGIQLFTRVGG